jgi:23S rRNA pseudouridine1911/1915/1917 synthase
MTPILPVYYEDQYLLVVGKPAGMIVHEGAGHAADAAAEEREEGISLLTDWIKAEHPAIVAAFANDPDPLYFRPGIVHRLDKETSGLIIIAKTPEIKNALQAKFKERDLEKEYVCLVLGKPSPEEGAIETNIARNPHHRREMAVSHNGRGKEAKTDYRLVQTWEYKLKGQKHYISLVAVTLHSGRMHQIRVHMKYKGWPVIGDPTYQTKISRNVSKELGLERQFLHARRLAFVHPVTGERVEVVSPLPMDLQDVVDRLEAKA